MHTPPIDDRYIEVIRFHRKPKPALLFLSTVLANGLLAILLYTAANGVAFHDYSVAFMPAVKTEEEEAAPDAHENGIAQSFSKEPLLLGSSNEMVDCTVSRSFPPSILRWCDLITRYAVKRGLPPDLVAAMIWQESGGDPSVLSRSGAVGLMQIMPKDGLASSFICVNGPCFSSRPTTQELLDPEFNIAYGTKLLSGLLGRHGDLREALKSYGPHDVGYFYADRVFGLFLRYGHSST